MTRARNYLRDRATYVDDQFNRLLNGEPDTPDMPDVPVVPDVPDTPEGYASFIIDGVSSKITIPGFSKNPSGQNGQILVETPLPLSAIPSESIFENYTGVDFLNQNKYQGMGELFAVTEWEGTIFLTFTLDMDLGVENTVESVTAFLSTHPMYLMYKMCKKTVDKCGFIQYNRHD